MGTEERLNGFFKNVVYAFFAQGISLLLSIMMSLVVPKMLNITEYGYWQLFIFYVGYVGFFHFGLNDGLYLKEGGKHYSQLNYSVIGTQYWMSILFESVFSCAILFGSILVLEDGNCIGYGTHEELLNKNGKYAEFWKMQTSLYQI